MGQLDDAREIVTPCAPSPLSSSRKPLLYETRSSANSCCRACDWPSARQRDSASSEPYPKRRIGLALFEAQIGRKARYAKPLRGYGGAGVLEVVDDFDGDTFRAVYTVRFAEAVYVLHAFQKKSRRGIATPRSEIELIRTRLRRAAEDYERWQKSEKRTSR
jgi:phage-related protein